MTKIRELAFIDCGLSDIPVLLRNLRPGVEAIVLDAHRPAPEQIADAVEGRPGPAAVHVLAHGRSGEIAFAAGPLSRATLQGHAAHLARIGRALDGGGLNLWSCHTSQGDAGHAFTQALAAAAGAPVAAATQLVGAAALGGQWTLDVREGAAGSPAPLTPHGIDAYAAVLETKTWSGEVSASWEDPGNWHPAGVPAFNDDVVIDAASLGVTISSDTAQLASLRVGIATVTLNGAKLDVSGGTGIELQDNLSSGIVGFGTVAGDMTGAGAIVARGGTLTLEGTVTQTSVGLPFPDPISFAIDPGLVSPVATTLKFAGTATAAIAIVIDDPDKTLEVGLGGDLTIDAAQTVSGGGKIVLSGGTLTDTAGLTIDIGSTLSGFGTVTDDITAGGGTIAASGGTLTVGGTVFNDGTVSVASSFLFDPLDPLAFGTATLSGTVLDNYGGVLSINGNVFRAQVSLTSTAGLGTDGVITGEVELTGNAVLEFATGTIDTIASDASLRLDGAVAHVTVADAPPDPFSPFGSNSALTGLSSNKGNFELANGAAVTVDGDLDNCGTISIDAGSGEFSSVLTVGGTLTNNGLVMVGNGTAPPGPAVTGLVAASLDNEGTVSIEAGKAMVTGDFANAGDLELDALDGSGGSTLTIGGALINHYTVTVGNCTLSGPTTLSAASLDNASGLLSITGSDTNEAAVKLASAAGLGTDGSLSGSVFLSGKALLEFGSGGIDEIESGAMVVLDGAQARINIATDSTDNSALTGLACNFGTFMLTNGAEVTTNVDFYNEFAVAIDALPGDGGSTLAIGGTLFNDGILAVGNACLSASTTLTAAALDNGFFGALSIIGGDIYQATVILDSAAGLCSEDGALDGALEMSGNALLQFAGGGTIDTIEYGASLWLDGAQARIVSIDGFGSQNALKGLAFNEGGFRLSNGASVTIDGDLDNDGGILLDAYDYEGGSTLTVGGTLHNTDTVAVGNYFQTGLTTLSVGTIDNETGALLSIVGGDIGNQARVSVGSLAGFGTAGSLTGDVELIGNALLKFAGGTFDTVDTDAYLRLDGELARIAVTGALDSNSALIGLTANKGIIELANGAAVTTTAGLDFVNTGDLSLDGCGCEGGSGVGTTLTIGGVLTNEGNVTVGNVDLSGPTTLSAAALDNDGCLSITGNGANQATVRLASAAGILEGSVTLTGNALLEFASGSIDTIADGAFLRLDGAQASVAAADSPDSSTNTALIGLADIQGTLELANGATATIYTLGNSGLLQIDGWWGEGGSSLSTAVLLNYSAIVLGNSALSSSAVLSAAAVVNLGSIDLYGNEPNEALLAVGVGLTNAGTITVHAGGVLDVGGELKMDDNSVLTAESGGTVTTGARTVVRKAGDGTTSIIDIQGQSFESQYKIVVESGALQFTGTAGLATPELTGAGIIQGEISRDGSNVLTITPTGLEVDGSLVFHYYHTNLLLAYSDVVASDGSRVITGSDFGEILKGGAFADTIYGGTGNDKLYGATGNDTLYGYAGDDKLYGGSGTDTLYGGEGKDRLDGGSGADVMKGGTGNDSYIVDNGLDQVFEASDEGTDTVYATVDYILADGQYIEILRAHAGGAALMLGGNEFDNKLYGDVGDDTLSGGGGKDRLDGGAGVDVMKGGTGDDSYIVDNGLDQVFEEADEGTDTVYAKVDYTLAGGQEIELLKAYAGGVGLKLGGNEFANKILGDSGDDTFDGGDGNDKLYGRDGADTLDGGKGNDRLYGESGDDELDGGEGNDRLYGGEGNDRLTGGLGADIFVFDSQFIGVTNIDTITDFDTASDSIQLNHAYFAGLALGQLSAAAFAVDGPTGTAPQIVYDSSTGSLSYDSNGADPGGASTFATVAGAPTLTHTSFSVV